MRCAQVYDENKRFAPKFDESVTTEIEGDTVLLSVGQSADLSFIDAQRDGIEMRSPQQIVNDPVTCATSAPGVFIAGDIAYGPRLMIHAIASGKKAARSVYRFCGARRSRPRKSSSTSPSNTIAAKNPTSAATLAHPHTLRGRTTEDPQRLVEIGYTEVQADGGRPLPGLRRQHHLRRREVHSVRRLRGCLSHAVPEAGRAGATGALARTGDRWPASGPRSGDSAILKDEDRCIRCALCAERCPTHAITMERFLFARSGPCPV